MNGETFDIPNITSASIISGTNVQYADNDTSATFHLINQERGNKYDKEFVCQMSQLMMTKEFMNDRCNVAK